MVNSQIISFFEQNDRFLKAQFEHAQGLSPLAEVHKSHAEILALTRKMKFADPALTEAQAGWLKILEGLSVNLGFLALNDLPKNPLEIGKYLDQYRGELGDTPFLPALKEFGPCDFQRQGTHLKTPPEQWIRDHDLSFDLEIEPDSFRRMIFAVSEFDPGDVEYRFLPSKRGDFFMMALHMNPTFFIGHGKLNSVFNLSKLAHEIGHSTTPPEKSLTHMFLTFPIQQQDQVLVNDEDDSYRYEKIFMDKADGLLKQLEFDFRFDLGFEGGLSALLAKRKAIQYNSHLLANQLNELFFSGEPLASISLQFKEKMKLINPSFAAPHDFSWVHYATLDQPLSKVGFLRAYRKNFL